MSIFLEDEQATLAMGARLAQNIDAPTLIFLNGNLGAGKTTLVRGFVQALGYLGNVKSPTYTIVETYEIHAKKVLHFDLYRIEDAEELELIGLADYFREDAIVFMEWPEHAKTLNLSPDLEVDLIAKATGRQLTMTAHTEAHQHLISSFAS
jgi:tRNA threonylcarbamoyladenosine biosynthesis protein TsaE